MRGYHKNPTDSMENEGTRKKELSAVLYFHVSRCCKCVRFLESRGKHIPTPSEAKGRVLAGSETAQHHALVRHTRAGIDRDGIRYVGKSWHVDVQHAKRARWVLFLLCHKCRPRFTELQCGQCPRALARATLSWKRSARRLHAGGERGRPLKWVHRWLQSGGAPLTCGYWCSAPHEAAPSGPSMPISNFSS